MKKEEYVYPEIEIFPINRLTFICQSITGEDFIVDDEFKW